MKKTMFSNLKLATVILTGFLSLGLMAQDKVVKDINLSVGILQDEPVPLAPEGFATDGKFRSLTGIQFNANTKTLRFNPKTAGVGTLFIKDPKTDQVIYEFRIGVTKTDLQKVAHEMRGLLSDIEGIQIKIINNKVVVDGQILLPRDMNRIHSVVKQYGERASSLVTLSPVAQSKIAQFIEKAINNPEITCRAVNGKFLLEGWAVSKDDKDRAEILAKTYVPDVVVDEAEADKKVLPRKVDVVINMINIKPAPEKEPDKIIQMVVHFVELSKDYTRGFRFQWTPNLGDGSELKFTSGQDGRSPSGIVSTITGTVSNLLPKLNWAKQHGHARVLQSSSIITSDGKPGVINSVSRIPYQVVNAQGQPSTNFLDAGMKVDITPQVLGARSDSVKMDMNFAVSSLVGITDQGPLTSSREIKTTITVRSGQSAAVGGLITNNQSTGYNKLPKDAATNPILSLYASRDFSRNQSQFVVFVTPIIKSSASTGAEQIKRKFKLSE